MKILSVVLLLIISLENLILAQENFTFSQSYDYDEEMLLSDALKPLHYLIKINPNIDSNDSFAGYVEIDLKVLRPTWDIVLHVADLDGEWTDAQILIIGKQAKENRLAKIVKFDWSEISQIMTLTLDQMLETNDTVRFSTEYFGRYSHNFIGFNQMEYLNSDGQPKRILATYFQPTGARHVFPCLDEPKFKARFTIHLAKEKEEIVLSNMDVQNRTRIGSLEWVEFQKSLPMSTYLVAFVVFDFKSITNYVGVGKEIRVWARDEILEGASYAASLASRALKWYEGYLDQSYPLRKLDIVTFPTYIVSGMENFGLIFTKENSLISSQSETTRQEWVATVTAHEVVHQWAGNLVTPYWWSDVWLSEGFATFLTALALDEIEPKMESINQLVVNNIQDLRDQQAHGGESSLILPNFEPLRDPLKNVFIYYKGAAVLRMMKSFLGNDNFQKGLRYYFRKYKFDSVSQIDFFDAMNESIPNLDRTLPVSLHHIMDAWTNRNKFPLVTVGRNKDGRFQIKQETYSTYNNPYGDQDSDNGTQWWIPVSYYTSQNSNFNDMKPKIWFPPSPDPMILTDTSSNDTWIVMNTQQMVDMRVNYDADLWKAITNVLCDDHSKIHTLNRAQIVDDSFKLFFDGRLEASVSLNLISYLVNEKSYYPFKSLLKNLDRLVPFMASNTNYNLLKNYVSRLLSLIVSDGPGKTHMSRKLYDLVYSWSCVFKHSECLNFSIEQFPKWKQSFNNSLFSHDNFSPFLCAAIEAGNETDWDIVYNHALQSQENLEKRSYYYSALTCTLSRDVINKYLNLILDPDNGLHYYGGASFMHKYLLRSEKWSLVTWEHIRSNWDLYFDRYPLFSVPTVVSQMDYDHVSLIVSDLLSAENSTIDPDYAQQLLDHSQQELTYTLPIITEVSEWLKENVLPV